MERDGLSNSLGVVENLRLLSSFMNYQHYMQSIDREYMLESADCRKNFRRDNFQNFVMRRQHTEMKISVAFTLM